MTGPYLLLWLEAPLQAWGHDSRFGRRDSLDFPTKSGVLGLLLCALGAGGEQRDLLAEMADLDLQVAAYGPADKDGQARPRLPLLCDFHMVGSGYDKTNPWQNLLIPKKADGSPAVGGGAKLTYRYYLQDMAFAVALEVPAARLDEFVAALQSPVWDLYLGRKNCAPTEFIYQGHYNTAGEALNQAGGLARNRPCPRALSFQVIQGPGDGEIVTLNDVPIQFGRRKLYRDRQVTVLYQAT